MTATFGKLHSETLTLQPGLNLLQMPNETGKSTWCAFLLCMLYGVDTSERESRTNFPIKKHYLPWSGNAMEGRLQLVHEGRRITIERSSTARAPLGVFRAFDTESGAPIKSLTAQNCGQTLLGVPRQVFERSAFLRQDGMAIQMDATLEQRLGALVTTGDETISYQEAEQILRERRNRCRHNKTGLIPQTQAALDGVVERISRLNSLQETLAQSRRTEQQLRAELATLRLQLSSLQAQQAQENRTQLAKAKEEASEKIDLAKALEHECRMLPAISVLQNWDRELNRLLSEQHTLALDAASLPQPQPAPTIPAAFSGLNADEMKQKANVDSAQMRLLQSKKKPSALPWLIPTLVLLLLAGGLAFGNLLLPAIISAILGAVIAAVGGIRHLGKHRAWRSVQLSLKEFYDNYGVTNPDDLEELSSRCRDEYTQWTHAHRLREAELAAFKEHKAKLDASCHALLGVICPALGISPSLTEANTQIRLAIDKQLRAEAAHRSAEQAYRHYSTLKEALGTVNAPRGPQTNVPEGKTIPGLQSEISSTEQKLQQVRSTLDHGEGQCSTLGDRMELEAKRQQLTARLAALNEEYDALSMALTVLGKANEALQNRFSPQLTALSAKYLSKLTDGAYSRLMLDRNLGANLYPAQAPASRESAYFSGGTRDQLYLAVRLGVSQLLAPGTPLILDDALVRFDDDRLVKALEVLQEEAEDRQVLLFTCQSRERTALQKCSRPNDR